LDSVKNDVRAVLGKKILSLKELNKILYKKGIMKFNGPPGEGKLMLDNVCLGEFKYSKKSNKIEVTKKLYVMENNYMKDKNNVDPLGGSLDDIDIQIIVELGRTRKSLSEISKFGEGTIFELNKMAGEPLDIFANNVKVATGEVVVIDENFGMRIINTIGIPPELETKEAS
jgi:flagellar motor switch protein FliN